MKNKDIFRLRDGLRSVGELRGVKFCYAVAKCLRMVVPVCEDLAKSAEPNDAYKKYDKEREALAKAHSKKDENNAPEEVPAGENRIAWIMADRKAFDDALDELKEKHREAVDEQDVKNKEFDALLEEEADEIKLHKISVDLAPEDTTIVNDQGELVTSKGINSAQFEAIFELWKEETE